MPVLANGLAWYTFYPNFILQIKLSVYTLGSAQQSPNPTLTASQLALQSRVEINPLPSSHTFVLGLKACLRTKALADILLY